MIMIRIMIIIKNIYLSMFKSKSKISRPLWRISELLTSSPSKLLVFHSSPVGLGTRVSPHLLHSVYRLNHSSQPTTNIMRWGGVRQGQYKITDAKVNFFFYYNSNNILPADLTTMSSAMESVFILFDANLQSYPPFKKKRSERRLVRSRKEI